MAVPRIFISSTYYDLFQVRDEIYNFLISIGYETVLHEKGQVAYTQNVTNEISCYNEIDYCDMLVCIIGNKFGTQSAENDYSITMNELLKAIKARKKIFIYILKDVFYENKTYLANKETGKFIPVYANDIKIHEFITDIKNNIKNHPIEAFEKASDIISNLKKQLAGLFQHLLTQEATVTEGKSLYDMQEIAEGMKDVLVSIKKDKEEIEDILITRNIIPNFYFKKLRDVLGLKKIFFNFNTLDGLTELLGFLGYTEISSTKSSEKIFKNKNIFGKQTITINLAAFEKDGKLKVFRSVNNLEDYINYEFEEEEGLPF